MAEGARSLFPSTLNHAMDALLRFRLDALRAKLSCSQLEKASLQVEIACTTTEKWQKQNAMFR
jgi:hypothetical protein